MVLLRCSGISTKCKHLFSRAAHTDSGEPRATLSPLSCKCIPNTLRDRLLLASVLQPLCDRPKSIARRHARPPEFSETDASRRTVCSNGETHNEAIRRGETGTPALEFNANSRPLKRDRANARDILPVHRAAFYGGVRKTKEQGRKRNRRCIDGIFESESSIHLDDLRDVLHPLSSSYERGLLHAFA